MNVNDLPQELLSRIREQFYATPKIRQMEVTRQMYMRKRKNDPNYVKNTEKFYK